MYGKVLSKFGLRVIWPVMNHGIVFFSELIQWEIFMFPVCSCGDSWKRKKAIFNFFWEGFCFCKLWRLGRSFPYWIEDFWGEAWRAVGTWDVHTYRINTPLEDRFVWFLFLPLRRLLAAEALWLLEHGNWRCAVSFLSDIGRYSAWPCWSLCLLAVQFCFIGTMSYFSTGGFAASCFLILTAFVTFSAMCCNATMSLLCLTPWYFLGGTLMEYLNQRRLLWKA